MSENALNAKSLRPQTVRYYKRSQELIFRAEGLFVPTERYQQFVRLERQLLRYQVKSSDYSFGISEALTGWVQKEDWGHLPINIFCGKWAVSYFVESVGAKEYSPPSWREERLNILLYDELLVARMYIDHAGAVAMDDVVAVLRPALTSGWLYRYRQDQRHEVKLRALDVLGEEHGRYIMDYQDLIEKDEDVG